MDNLENLKFVLERVSKSGPATESMRAALALATLDKAVTDAGESVLTVSQIQLLSKIINGETG